MDWQGAEQSDTNSAASLANGVQGTGRDPRLGARHTAQQAGGHDGHRYSGAGRDQHQADEHLAIGRLGAKAAEHGATARGDQQTRGHAAAGPQPVRDSAGQDVGDSQHRWQRQKGDAAHPCRPMSGHLEIEAQHE